MSHDTPFWQMFVLLLILCGGLAGLAFHFIPSLKKHARHMLGRILNHPRMPQPARQYAASRLLAQRASACGCCSGCSSAPPLDTKITLVPRRKNENPPAA